MHIIVVSPAIEQKPLFYTELTEKHIKEIGDKQLNF